jgi:hypothetical protein
MADPIATTEEETAVRITVVRQVLDISISLKSASYHANNRCFFGFIIGVIARAPTSVSFVAILLFYLQQ